MRGMFLGSNVWAGPRAGDAGDAGVALALRARRHTGQLDN